jgi:uncharacterized protein
MRVVLDTNVLLVSIAPNSLYRPIFDALLAKKYTLVLSNDILAEYEEIISKRANPKVANLVLEALSNLSNVIKQDIFVKWIIIDSDKDDNKFVDCAIAGNCQYIVTNDRHFNVLKERGNDLVGLINIDTFLIMLTETE